VPTNYTGPNAAAYSAFNDFMKSISGGDQISQEQTALQMGFGSAQEMNDYFNNLGNPGELQDYETSMDYAYGP